MSIKERIGFVTLTLVAALVGGAVSGHIFAARAVDAAAAPRMITAQKFMLVDAKGNARGEFNVTSRGVAQLAVFDGTGTLRAGLGVGSDGAPALGIFGHDGKPRIEVGLANSIARIMLYNATALPQATLGVAPDGQSGLDLLDKDGIPRASIVVAANGAPLVGDTRRFAEARCRFAFGCTVLSAGVPMFLFGEEVGFQNDFLYNQILKFREDLQGLRRTSGRLLFTFYSDLIRLRLDNPGLRSSAIDVLHVHDANRVLAWRRWGESDDFLVLASLNNHAYLDGYDVSNSRLADGDWKEVFNSDLTKYGGDNIGNFGATAIPSRGGVLHAVIPANGFVVLKRI